MKIGYELPLAIFGATAIVFAQSERAYAALTTEQIAKVAEQVSVRIDGQAPGSGVIIARQGQTYFVLTAAHVVATEDEYEIVTPDRQRYKIVYQKVVKFQGADLAVVQFTSPRNYQIATLGDSSRVQRGAPVYVTGWPAGGNAINNPTLLFLKGIVAASSQVQQAEGYGLIYNNPTVPGMSGGPVLNVQGELVGIHGRGETDQHAKTSNPSVVVKVGLNLGIPINTFRALAPKSGINLAALTAPRPATAPTQRPVDDLLVQASQKLLSKDYKAVLEICNRIIGLDPQIAEAYRMRSVSRISSLGGSYVIVESPRNRPTVLEAEKDIEEAVRLDPRNYESFYARASIRKALGNKPGWLEDMNQALKLLEPDSVDMYLLRAELKIDQKDWRGAIEDLNKGLALNPKPYEIPATLAMRGYARIKVKDYLSAIQDYSEAMRLEPNDPALPLQRGIARYLLRDKQGALSDLQKAADMALTQGQMEVYEIANKHMRTVRFWGI
jgi:tetratricopeptide (TPR) repeat protein